MKTLSLLLLSSVAAQMCTKGSDAPCISSLGEGACCLYNNINPPDSTTYICLPKEGVAALVEAHKLIGSDTVTSDGVSVTQYCAGAAKLAVGTLASAAIYTSF